MLPSQARWMREIVALYTQKLPAMQLFFGLNHPSVVKGFNALQADFAGGLQPSGFYGSYFRNSHLWEWTS